MLNLSLMIYADLTASIGRIILKNFLFKTLQFVYIYFILIIYSTFAFASTEIAYFSGGCFWCTEDDFEKIHGVKEVVSGYMGGTVKNPEYKQVASGTTGHYEVVRIIFDSTIITYQNLLSAFWRMHDPSDGTGSFCDRGQQYSTAIFYTNQQQKKRAYGAISALNKVQKFDTPIATKLLKADLFYKAEDYHQDYSKRNPIRYHYYRFSCGRDQFIKKTWAGDNTIYQTNNGTP